MGGASYQQVLQGARSDDTWCIRKDCVRARSSAWLGRAASAQRRCRRRSAQRGISQATLSRWLLSASTFASMGNQGAKPPQANRAPLVAVARGGDPGTWVTLRSSEGSG
jgi:hypothetical protein